MRREIKYQILVSILRAFLDVFRGRLSGQRKHGNVLPEQTEMPAPFKKE